MSMTTQICACRTVLNHLFPISPNLQVTVMHSMQAGYMDKAQKYTDKALLQISKLKILDSHPILSSFQLMLLEHIIMCRLVMGHKSLAVQEVSSYLYCRCRIHIHTFEGVWLYAVKAQTSLAPLSCLAGSRGLMRMRTNIVYFRVMRRLYRRELNWLCVNLHPWQRTRDHGVWRLTLTAYSLTLSILCFVH